MSQKTFSAEIEVAVKQTIWIPMVIKLKAKDAEDAYSKLSTIKEPADLAVLLEDGATLEEATSVDEVLVGLSAQPIRDSIESREWEFVEFTDDDSIEESEDEDGDDTEG